MLIYFAIAADITPEGLNMNSKIFSILFTTLEGLNN